MHQAIQSIPSKEYVLQRVPIDCIFPKQASHYSSLEKIVLYPREASVGDILAIYIEEDKASCRFLKGIHVFLGNAECMLIENRTHMLSVRLQANSSVEESCFTLPIQVFADAKRQIPITFPKDLHLLRFVLHH